MNEIFDQLYIRVFYIIRLPVIETPNVNEILSFIISKGGYVEMVLINQELRRVVTSKIEEKFYTHG